MDVSQLLHELLMVAHVEVVIALLPEVFCFADQPPCDSLLQRLECCRQRGPFGLAKEQVDVFGHDDVAVHAKRIVAPDTFERSFEHQLRAGIAEGNSADDCSKT